MLADLLWSTSQFRYVTTCVRCLYPAIFKDFVLSQGLEVVIRSCHSRAGLQIGQHVNSSSVSVQSQVYRTKYNRQNTYTRTFRTILSYFIIHSFLGFILFCLCNPSARFLLGRVYCCSKAPHPPQFERPDGTYLPSLL